VNKLIEEEFIPWLCAITFMGTLVSATLVFLFSLISMGEYYVYRQTVKVECGGEVFYEGRRACVTIESAGSATKVDVSKGLFCMFPAKTCTDSNVSVVTIGK
jgi:hypothetical protein